MEYMNQKFTLETSSVMPLPKATSADALGENVSIGDFPAAWIIAVTVFSITGNCLVIAAFFRDARLRVFFNLFAVHLAVADVILSTVVLFSVIDDITQVSILGSSPIFCQVCTVIANAVILQQLIVTHIMCSDRHRTLQHGLSYTRHSSQWHMKKLILFLTWVVSFVGSFLVTDLMSSLKLDGFGSCKLPGRFLYVSYTSFLHFGMLGSLAVALMLIILKFRKRRKMQLQFERLPPCLEDDSSFCLPCQSQSASQETHYSVQSLIPRSPLHVSRNFSTPLPSSPETKSSCRPISFSPPSCSVQTNLPWPKPDHNLSQALPYPPSENEDHSLTEIISPPSLDFCPRTELYSQCQQNVQELAVKKDLIKLSDQGKEDNQICPGRCTHQMDIDETSLHLLNVGTRTGVDIQPQCNSLEYSRFNQIGQEVRKNNLAKQDTRAMFPGNGNPCSSDAKSRDAQATEWKSLTSQGQECPSSIYIFESSTQAKEETNKNTEEVSNKMSDMKLMPFSTHKSSSEDFFPASSSLSDDDPVDLPLPRLRPRTDSLYTLCSCLSMSQESLSRMMDDCKNISSHSEVSVSNRTSETSVKSRRESQNEKRLFSIDDENDWHIDPKTDSDVKARSDSVHSLPGFHIFTGFASSQSASHQYCTNAVVVGHGQNKISHLLVPSGSDSTLNRSHRTYVKSIFTGKQQQVSIKILFQMNRAPQDRMPSVTHNAGTSGGPNNLVQRKVVKISSGETQPKQSSAGTDDNSEDSSLIQCNENCSSGADMMVSDVSKQKECSPRPKDDTEIGVTSGNIQAKCEHLTVTSGIFLNDNNSAGIGGLNESLELDDSGRNLKGQSTSDNCGSAGSVSDMNDQQNVKSAADAGDERGIETFEITESATTSAENPRIFLTGPSRQTISVTNLTHEKHSFGEINVCSDDNIDVVSVCSSDKVQFGHSQKDIELAVQAWIDFYRINLTSPYKSSPVNKLIDKFSCQPVRSSLKQSDESLDYSDSMLVKARQIWLDFYGIDMTKKISPRVECHPNGHLISVPVEVHAADNEVHQDLNNDKPQNKQIQREGNSSQLRPSIFSAKPDHENGEIDPTGHEDLQSGFKTDVSSTGLHQQFSLGECLTNDVYQRTNFSFKSRELHTNEFPEDQLMCSTVRSIDPMNDVAMRPINTANVTDEIYRNCKMDLIAPGKYRSAESLLMQENISVTQQCVQPHEASFLKISGHEQADGSKLVLSCICPSENSISAFRSICNIPDFNSQMDCGEFDNKTYSQTQDKISRDVANIDRVVFEHSKIEGRDLYKEEEEEEITQEDSNEKEVGGQTKVHDTSLTTDHEDSRLHDKILNSDKKQQKTNTDVINNELLNGFAKGRCNEHISVSENKDPAEDALTTYQILESTSITYRALLVELGLYEDVLTGVIPLQKELLNLNECRNLNSCLDCERRDREKMRKMSSMESDTAKEITLAAAADFEDEMPADTTGNASICGIEPDQNTQTDSSLVLLNRDIELMEDEGLSEEYNLGSYQNPQFFQDIKLEGDLSRRFSLASRLKVKDYFFLRLPQTCKCRKFTLEQLKAKNPEMCILISLVCIVMLQLICWLPITVLYMVYDIIGFPQRPSNEELVFMWMWCFRMATQPVLYATYSKYFRENYVHFLCSWCV